MTYTEIDNYRKPDGLIDWKAFDAAQIANGEKCYRCCGLILFAREGRQLCGNCKQLDSKGEVHHPNFIKCPFCGHFWDVMKGENYGLLREGERDVSCESCDKTFEVETRVSFVFYSRKKSERRRY